MSKPKTFEEWDTNVRPGLPRFRDAGRSDRRSAWHAAREALIAELLEAEKTYPEDPSRVIEWCVGVGGSSWYVSVELLRALTGLVARLRGDLSESRAESAALRKKVEDLLAHAREVEDQRNDLQERWSDEHDEAQRLRKRLAEAEETPPHGCADAEAEIARLQDALADADRQVVHQAGEIEELRKRLVGVEGENSELRKSLSDYMDARTEDCNAVARMRSKLHQRRRPLQLHPVHRREARDGRRGTGREDRGMGGGAMSEHEPTKKLLEAVNDSKRLDGDPDVLVSMAERVLAEALAYAVEGYADLMDVAPPLLNDVESSKKQIIFIMDALAATSACRYRDAHE